MLTALSRYRRPLTALGILGPASYFAYRYYKSPGTAPTFQVTIRQRMANGQVERVPLTLPLLPTDEVERRLKANEFLARLPKGWRYTTNYVNSNDPIEDAHASAVASRSDKDSFPADNADLLMFAVMDGHGGRWTSRLLAKTLLPGVALELQTLDAQPPKPDSSSSSFLKYFWPLPGFGSFQAAVASAPRQFSADPTYVQLAIKTAFAQLDSAIVNAPYRTLWPLLKATNGAPIDVEKYPMALPTLLPALSGSCALLALVDTSHDALYVACTGDSRAVAGVADKGSSGELKWKVDVLSEDQTGRNPSELKRIQSEHPADEADRVVQRGRILGGLEPSRAFGDSRYKWPREFQQLLSSGLDGTGQALRKPPADLKTPPYVTCEPVLTHRSLSTPATAHGPALRFIVLATDGLWDQLSSAEVVALVGAHLRGTRGTVPKTDLTASIAEGGNMGLDGKQIERTPYKRGESWTFVDENLSTHLIRNAIGGGDPNALRKSLSIPAPHARRFRDDITVTVVWWEETDTLVGGADASQPSVKAKL